MYFNEKFVEYLDDHLIIYLSDSEQILLLKQQQIERKIVTNSYLMKQSLTIFISFSASILFTIIAVALIGRIFIARTALKLAAQ